MVCNKSESFNTSSRIRSTFELTTSSVSATNEKPHKFVIPVTFG